MVARAGAPEEKRTRLDQRMWGNLSTSWARNLSASRWGVRDQEQVKIENMVII